MPYPVPSFYYALHSLEHALLKAFPDHIRCDRDEIGGMVETRLPGLAGRIYLYDDFPEGLGLADDFAFDPLPILAGALHLIERCTCDDDAGCPVCLAYFGCQSFNGLLSKLAGRYLLRSLLQADRSGVLADLPRLRGPHRPRQPGHAQAFRSCSRDVDAGVGGVSRTRRVFVGRETRRCIFATFPYLWENGDRRMRIGMISFFLPACDE